MPPLPPDVGLPLGCFSTDHLNFRRQLKADSPAGTLVEFDLALAAGVQLPSNVLCGILNQFAKAGWMDDCMRVCQEMKGK